MPLADILAAIDAEAATTISGLESQAEVRVAEVLEAGRVRAEHERARRATARDETAAAAAARTVNQARLSAERELRAAQEELFRECLAMVEQRLRQIRGSSAYRNVFRDLLTEALEAMPTVAVLRVDPADRELAETTLAALDRQVTIEPTISTWGGVETATDDGREVRNTLESRLYRAERALRNLAVARCPELIEDLE